MSDRKLEWEYLVRFLDTENLNHNLNVLGDQGWELVDITVGNVLIHNRYCFEPSLQRCVFKRPAWYAGHNWIKDNDDATT